MLTHNNILPLFIPKSIAIVGASRSQYKVGYKVLQNLLTYGYNGKVFPINPNPGIILGINTLSNVFDIPKEYLPLDLACICIPSEYVVDCMKELAEIGTKAVVIISSNFKENYAKTSSFEEEINAIAYKNNMVVLGPNSMGIINTYNNTYASINTKELVKGNIGFFSESSTFCSAVLDWSKAYSLGFSNFVSIGNKTTVDESDLLNYLANDSNTSVIAGYLDSINDSSKFLKAAHLATRKKPVILLKSGRTATGAKVAIHNKSSVGEDVAYGAIFKQTGIIRASQTEDFLFLAKAFSTQPLSKGPGVAIISNAIEPSVLAADACELEGLNIASFSNETIKELSAILPHNLAVHNPINVSIDYSFEQIKKIIDILDKDHNVHSIVILITSNHNKSSEHIFYDICSNISVLDNKPILFCLMGGNVFGLNKDIPNASKFPCYTFPESALFSIGAMYKHYLWKNSPLPVEVIYRKDTTKAKKIIEQAKSNNNFTLTDAQTNGVLLAYELPFLEAKLARTSEEAIKIAKQIGYPVAVKIASPQVDNKINVMGVMLDIKDQNELKSAFLEVTSNCMRIKNDAYISGCYIQSMAAKNSIEVVIGAKNDPNFGALVYFSLSGVHKEKFKDISYRLAPISLEDAHAMVREINAFPVLAGLNGKSPVKFTALEDILLILSKLALDLNEVEEIECNPVFINEKGAQIVNCKINLIKNNQY